MVKPWATHDGERQVSSGLGKLWPKSSYDQVSVGLRDSGDQIQTLWESCVGGCQMYGSAVFVWASTGGGYVLLRTYSFDVKLVGV